MLEEIGLKQIENLGETDTEFLVAAGVEDVISLARSSAPALRQEMEGANAILSIDEVVPSIPEIEGWIKSARAIGDIEEIGNVVKLGEEADLETFQILDAIPISSSVLIEQRIGVQDVAPMEVFIDEDFEPDPEPVRVEREEKIEDDHSKISIREVVSMTVRRTDEPDDGTSLVQPLEKNSIHDIRKTASAELNAGKKLHSRGYIRGVLHPQPVRVRMGAILSIMALVLFPAIFVAGGLMLAKYTLWLAVIPAAFLVFGILYFLYARGLKCRICGQPLFAPKACGRHVKAHRLPMLGYILPTCFHILLFHWFRCMYCGTSVRIKE